MKAIRWVLLTRRDVECDRIESLRRGRVPRLSQPSRIAEHADARVVLERLHLLHHTRERRQRLGRGGGSGVAVCVGAGTGCTAGACAAGGGAVAPEPVAPTATHPPRMSVQIVSCDSTPLGICLSLRGLGTGDRGSVIVGVEPASRIPHPASRVPNPDPASRYLLPRRTGRRLHGFDPQDAAGRGIDREIDEAIGSLTHVADPLA